MITIRYLLAPISVTGAIIVAPYIYRKLIRLNELKKAIESVDTMNHRKSGFFHSIIRTIRLVYMYLVILLYKRLFGTKIISKKLSYVSYFHNMKWYYFPVISKRGPKKVIESVNDECNIDKTELIIRLAGPNVDFYGNNIRPRDVNCEVLTVFVDDEKKIFNEDEVIDLDN